VALSLNEKARAVEAKEKDGLSVREITMRFECGKTQVYKTFKQKDKIMNEWLQGNGRMKRNVKVTDIEEMNEGVGVVHECKLKIIDVSDPMDQSEDLAVARSLGNDQSTGRLDRSTILCGTESVGNLNMWMEV
jgi:hypothetical protein